MEALHITLLYLLFSKAVLVTRVSALLTFVVKLMGIVPGTASGEVSESNSLTQELNKKIIQNENKVSLLFLIVVLFIIVCFL